MAEIGARGQVAFGDGSLEPVAQPCGSLVASGGEGIPGVVASGVAGGEGRLDAEAPGGAVGAGGGPHGAVQERGGHLPGGRLLKGAGPVGGVPSVERSSALRNSSSLLP
ncbi:hypothetical protein GA0115252_111621 [Streptomyces sp. DfronAA-171]|nr:hypothetical protein GA0115252_111621 [Streptomyces sp. DfronAA-171]